MVPSSVTVMGGGVAGMAAALLLARDGGQVTLLERDAFDVGQPAQSPAWSRRGIPHFLQPHAFIPRGRVELRRHLPDVYEALLKAGAHEVDVRAKIPGPIEPGDEDLNYLAVRRPLIEWALRQAVVKDPRIAVRSEVQVTGITLLDAAVTAVTAVHVDGQETPVELAVDALGRRTPVPGWLAEAGLTVPPPESTDCGVVYYSRYYRLREGRELADGAWLLGPRGDLGYLGYSTFPGDNGTFAALLAVPTGAPDWRTLKDPEAFEAAVAQIPPLRRWVDPDSVDPITGVVTMAGLRNTIRPYDPLAVPNLVPIGDAMCHTDPVIAHGLSFGLIHAIELAAAVRDHDDVQSAAVAYADSVSVAVRERYELASALDEQRHRMWIGEPVDVAHRDGDYALFALVAGGVAAMMDPDVFRVMMRRNGLLDSTTVLDSDVELCSRIESLFAKATSGSRPLAGPTREAMLRGIEAVRR